LSSGTKEFDEVIPPLSKEEEEEIRRRKERSTTVEQPSTTPEIPQTPTFKKFMGNTNDAYIHMLERLAPMNEYTIEIGEGETKTFQRRKIRGKQYRDIEQLRAKYAQLQKEGKVEQASETYIEIYKKCALYYLGMTEEEFDDGDMEQIKMVCDACSHRTLYAVPY